MPPFISKTLAWGQLWLPLRSCPLGKWQGNMNPTYMGRAKMHLALEMPPRPKDLTHMGRGRSHLNSGMMPHPQRLVQSIRGSIM